MLIVYIEVTAVPKMQQKYVQQSANAVSSAKRVHLSWRCNSMKPIIAVKRQRVCGLWLARGVQ